MENRQWNTCRKNNRLKKLKIKTIKNRKEYKNQNKEKKDENSIELQKLNIDTEVYNSNKNVNEDQKKNISKD